jgi:nucleotide-binding universal stress UspA family protein
MNSNVVLLHVATGVAAQFNGPDAAGEEVNQDRAYLQRLKSEFSEAEIPTEARLAFGDPVKEILKWIDANACDLVAMSTHGHQFVADPVLGTTANRVQHSVRVPVLLLRAK